MIDTRVDATENDIIWLHPNQNQNGNQNMYIGNNQNQNQNNINLNGTLAFHFLDNDMVFTSPSVYIMNDGIDCNIIFDDNSNNNSIIIH